MIFVKFPRDEGNRVIEFKDMPVIRQQVYFAPEDKIYKVTEIIRKPIPKASATILVRR